MSRDDLDAAVQGYEEGELTLGEAAQLVDTDRWTMRDILRERDVEIRVGLAGENDAEDEADAAQNLDFEDEDSIAKKHRERIRRGADDEERVSGLETALTDKEDWDEEAFPDSGDAMFGDLGENGDGG